MGQPVPINRKTLASAISNAIAECDQLLCQDGGRSWQLQQDTSEAIRNLKWIQDELEGRVPPRSIPTQAFARYVIDEGEDSRMQLPKDLRDRITDIEYFYLRKVWKKRRWWQLWF